MALFTKSGLMVGCPTRGRGLGDLGAGSDGAHASVWCGVGRGLLGMAVGFGLGRGVGSIVRVGVVERRDKLLQELPDLDFPGLELAPQRRVVAELGQDGFHALGDGAVR